MDAFETVLLQHGGPTFAGRAGNISCAHTYRTIAMSVLTLNMIPQLRHSCCTTLLFGVHVVWAADGFVRSVH